jgi:hypothetical protein
MSVTGTALAYIQMYNDQQHFTSIDQPVGRWYARQYTVGDGSGGSIIAILQISTLGMLKQDMFYDTQFLSINTDVSLAGAGYWTVTINSSEQLAAAAGYNYFFAVGGFYTMFPFPTLVCSPTPVCSFKMATSKVNSFAGIQVSGAHNAGGQGLAVNAGGYLYDMGGQMIRSK